MKHVSQTSPADQLPLPLGELQQHQIKRAAIGPRHFAFLTEDGAVCRLGYTADSQILEAKPNVVEEKNETQKPETSSSPYQECYKNCLRNILKNF